MIIFDPEKEYIFLDEAETQYVPIKVLQVSGGFAKISYQNREGTERRKIVPIDLIMMKRLRG